MSDAVDSALTKYLCELDHLYFTRYFFKHRQSIKFRVNFHHVIIADVIEKVISGEYKNVVINVAPGSSKTELVVINLIARGLAINPRSRFLHLSGSDTLALLNSATARDLVQSDEYQALWPLKIRDDSSSKKRWNVEVDGKEAGGVYATSLGGQITGFRAGHMTEGWTGAIILDDPLKPEDAYSKVKTDAANRKLVSTVRSRKANPDTPIILVMQRISENDPTGFIEAGNLGKPSIWTIIKIPALIDDDWINKLDPKYKALVEIAERDEKGRQSYWPYKEPLHELLEMEQGAGTDQSGKRVSKHVFNAQYNQSPVAIGGNIIRGEHFGKYKILPKILYRNIYADTAQKAKEHNDFSVFQEWGFGADNKIYLIDMLRGRWEGPELRARARAFWAKCKARNVNQFGSLRRFKVEDASSGTDLIQTLKLPPDNITIEGIKRNRTADGKALDKFSRVMDVLPYIEIGLVNVPADAPFTNDLIAELESFSADDSHQNDDSTDALVDATMDLLSNQNKMKIWQALAEARQNKDV